MGKNKQIALNEKIVSKYSYEDFKTLHIYGVTTYLTVGYGYIAIPEYITQVQELCNISARTVGRWITRLKQSKLISIKKGIIYIKGRKTLEQNTDTSRIYIKYEAEHLKSYLNFQKHSIQQLALLTQQRMSHHVVKSKIEDPNSLVYSGVVETELAVIKNRKKTGCSISQLTKQLGFDKMTISRALKGHTEKQFGKTLPIKGKVVRFKYKNLINGITSRDGSVGPQWGFEYNSKCDTYILTYALASRIVALPYLSRKRKNNNVSINNNTENKTLTSVKQSTAKQGNQ